MSPFLEGRLTLRCKLLVRLIKPRLHVAPGVDVGGNRGTRVAGATPRASSSADALLKKYQRDPLAAFDRGDSS